MKKEPLFKSPRYKRFVNDRDRYLEQIHRNAQMDVSRILHEALERTLEIVSRGYAMIPEGGFFTAMSRGSLELIERRLDLAYKEAAIRIADRWMTMRRNTFTIASLSETEAIGQATGKKSENRLTRQRLDAVALAKTASDEDLLARITLSLNRIKRSVLDAVETSRVHEDKLSDALERVTKKFPKPVIYRRPPRELSPIKESDSFTQPEFVSITFVDDEYWLDAVEHYKRTELPSTRFFNEPIDVDIGEAELEEWYSWEIEQELTHDFVHKVRSGQEDAANKAGIKDFVWVAILDANTDTCCSWRAGLTTKEIEHELEGRHRDDECKALVPPAHMNCRCQLAPIGEVEERVPLDLGAFSDWLMEP